MAASSKKNDIFLVKKHHSLLVSSHAILKLFHMEGEYIALLDAVWMLYQNKIF